MSLYCLEFRRFSLCYTSVRLSILFISRLRGRIKLILLLEIQAYDFLKHMKIQAPMSMSIDKDNYNRSKEKIGKVEVYR